MIYCSDKKTVEEYYYCSPFIPDTTTQPYVIKEIVKDRYFIRFGISL